MLVQAIARDQEVMTVIGKEDKRAVTKKAAVTVAAAVVAVAKHRKHGGRGGNGTRLRVLKAHTSILVKTRCWLG